MAKLGRKLFEVTSSREKMRGLERERKASGLTIKEFCESKGIKVPTYNLHKRLSGLVRPYTKKTAPTA
jgi:hypothetical protein